MCGIIYGMRPKGTPQQLAARRKRAFQLLKKKGRKVAEVAQSLGVTPRSVQRWRSAEKHPSAHRKNKRSPGRPRRLTERQMERLRKVLLKGAFAQGYAEDYWTLERIAHVIWELFHVRYKPNSVWHVMQRLKWSCQKPQRVFFQHDEEEIAHWKHYVWPRIKKVA
jgi:transposase